MVILTKGTKPYDQREKRAIAFANIKALTQPSAK